MSEPTGHTIDGTPWEEARGPHLPDPVVKVTRRIPILAWVFIVLTILDVAWGLSTYASISVSVLTSALPLLLGAAIFARHPDAWRTHRQLAIGAILLAITEGFQIGAVIFSDGLLAIGPSTDETFLASAGSTTWWIAGLVIGVFGLAYVAQGIANGRQGNAAGSSGRYVTALTALAVLAAVLSTGSVGVLASRYDIEFRVLEYGATAIADLATILIWGYLTRVTWAGAAAGDRPTGAWRLAGIAGVMVLIAYLAGEALGGVTNLIAAPDMDLNGLLPLQSLIGLTRTIGFGLLVIAFVLGLPSEDEPAV